jgi:3D-(3,5/4)-trihydroxycyclohexane-1,2-dione acylhydrolase (decyclizing)
VNEAAGDRGVLVAAAGGLPGDLQKLWRTPRPGGYHLEYGYSTMGYEIAGGLGVKMAEPETEVYVMLGDGSYLMLATEIATAVQEDRKLTIVLLDNHGFQCILNLSGECGGANDFNRFRMRDAATGRLSGEFLPIDFAANAASLGADVLVAHSPAELETALAEARSHRNTTVVVVEIDPSVGVPAYDSWWDVPVAEVSTSDRVRAARETYVERMRTERSLL